MLTRARWARIVVAGMAVLVAGSMSASAAAAPPLNDSFSSPEVMSGRAASTFGTNKDATKEVGEPDHADEAGGASVWYRWTAPASGRAAVSTCDGSSLDTVIAVYTGDIVGSLTVVASDDDACGPQSFVAFQAVAGSTYRIAVDAVGGDTGSFDLNIRLSPPNDDFAAAVDLAGDAGEVGGLTVGASIEDGEPSHYYGGGFPSVWYRWTAPSSGWATFQTCGLESVIAVYTGSALDGLTEVASDGYACWPGSRVSFEATGGTSYVVAVAGEYGFESEFTLAWNRNPPPPEPPYTFEEPRLPSAATEGQAVTVAEGEWQGAQPISFGYAWGRCDREFERCGLIAGANGRTYVPAAGDVGLRLYVRVTATNSAGSMSEFSNFTAPVAARPPLNTVVPFVSGAARLGSILVATSGEWAGTGPMSLAYQWELCSAAEVCSDLAGEAGPVIRVGAAHVGMLLRVVVTATNPGGSASAASDTTAAIRRARRCVVPNVKGKAVAAARRAIRRAGCTTGRIRRSHSASVRRGRIVSQSPRAGARRPAGAKVGLVLSKGKKR